MLEVGVPESCPVLALKLAQPGLLVIENVSGFPLGSVVEGVKLYADPAVTEVGGEPLMVGGLLEAFTVIEKPGREAELVPSLTEITMPEKVPTLPEDGVPESCPVLVLKAAQDGFAAILKVRVMPLGALLVGVKL